MPYKDKEKARQYMKARYDLNKADSISRSQHYYQMNKEKVKAASRNSHLRNKYGLDQEEYLQMVLDQNNKCAICNQFEHRLTKTKDIKPLSVDHNHNTGAVRALLCNDCNAMLGFAKENPELLKAAINYLEEHSDGILKDPTN